MQPTDDSDIVLGSLKLPESNVDSDTTLTLSLQLVQHPSVLEGTLSEFSSFLLELLDGTLVDTTTLDSAVNQLPKHQMIHTAEDIPCRSSGQWWSTYQSRRAR